jgi:two-component system nitrate/nitrite response regulator NarL
MRVLVFSSIRLFGEGVAACLEGDEGVEATCCHCAGDVLECVTSFVPDVVLVDVAQQDGLREGRALTAACPDVPIVALALADASSHVIACADAGFVSYVPRDASFAQLRNIIDLAMRGEVLCDPKVSGALLRELRVRRRQAIEEQSTEPLTRRECEVLRLLGRGLSNKAIARHLSLSEATVKNHVHEILTKLRVRRRAEAMVCLREKPWILKVG